MPVPKRRTSRRTRDSRRTHQKLEVPGLSTCTTCAALIRPHRVCPECGHYKDAKIIEVADF